MDSITDPSYLQKLGGRSERLHRYEITVRQDTAHLGQEFDRAAAELATDVAILRNELAKLEIEVQQTASRAKAAVAKFKQVVKRGELARLQLRAEAWGPHQAVCRAQFKRMLSDRFS